MPTVNELFADAAIDHAVDLYQYSTGVVRRMIRLLNRVDADLAAALAVALDDLPAKEFTVARLEALLGSVRKLNRAAYARVEQELTDELRNFAGVESQYQGDLFEATYPGEIQARFPIARITEQQVYAAAVGRPFQGRLLRDWAKKIEADRMEVLRNTVRLGFLEGQTVSQIVTRLRGTRENRYADGTFAKSRRELETVVRSAIGHTASIARDQMHASNADIIAAEIWSSTIDTKTSEMCRIRDELRYTVKEHKPIGHKVPWLQGPGRIHRVCRSASRPQTKSWQELGFEITELSTATRASMDGQISEGVAYGDWLERQPAHRQDQVVGPTRGRLMREGKLPFERLYSNRGDYLSIDELKQRNADAFKRAGL